MKHLSRLLFNSRGLGLLTLVFLLLLVIDPAIAKPPNCVDPDPRPSCQDDGGENLGYVTTAADNWAYWDSGKYIWEKTPSQPPPPPPPPLPLDFFPRYCGNGDPADSNPQGYVAYICHEEAYATWPMVNTVHINLDGVPRDGAPEGPGDNGLTAAQICEFAEGGSTTTYGDLVMNLETSESRAYYYGMDPTWNEGPCIDPDNNPDTCLVLFATTAYFDDRAAHREHCSDRKCGRLVQLSGWGQAEPAGEIVDNIYEYNPFVNQQDIEIDELTVTFRAIGKNKVAARCHYKPEPDTIWFKTRLPE